MELEMTESAPTQEPTWTTLNINARQDLSAELASYLLRTAQVIVVVQVVLGAFLLGSGKKPPDSLHYVYGIAPLVVSLICEAARVAIAQSELEAAGDIEALDRREQILLARRVVLREIGTMTIGAILIVTLALRAASTGGGF